MPARSPQIQALAPARNLISDTGKVEEVTKNILAAVKAEGDKALERYSQEFDKVTVESLEITNEERQAAVSELDPAARADMEFAIERVRAFAEAQRSIILPLEIEALPGLHLGHRVIRSNALVPMSPGDATRSFLPRS